MIFFAEDDPSIGQLVCFKLKKAGFSIHWVRDGSLALQEFALNKWGLVILDVMMPGADGWTVLKHIREESEDKDVPVLMLTARGQKSDMDLADQNRATDFLKKPFDPEDLVKKVKQHLRGDL